MEITKELETKIENAIKRIKSIKFGYIPGKLYLLSFEEIDLLNSIGYISDEDKTKEKMYREQMAKEVWG